jgi:prepilin-type N-terminal cleavage/methylation domain-containing protein
MALRTDAPIHNAPRRAVTLMELLVVLMIMAILSTVAAGVYSREVMRARFARARSEIRTLEIAINQYEVDTGQYPPSGSGPFISPNSLVTVGIAEGSGYLQLALRASLNNNPTQPLSRRWNGPYIDWDYNQLGDALGNRITTPAGANTPPGLVNFLDPFGNPYLYIRASDYDARGGTLLPTSNPFSGSERWFNPTTFQIISPGPNGTYSGTTSRGLEDDDLSNFLGYVR